jgi:hypothetical protein
MTNPIPPLKDLDIANDKALINLIREFTCLTRYTFSIGGKNEREVINGNRPAILEVMQEVKKRINMINEDFQSLENSINKHFQKKFKHIK